MKTFVPFKQFLLTCLLSAAVMTICKAQPQLVFTNPTLEPGSPAAGMDSAVYRFPSVTTNVDALVKINGRSSSLVTLSNIDVTNTGFDKAFQPQVAYNNGNVSGARSWWMEFKITFVNRNTTTPVNITTFDATALDIDGDNNHLHEWDAFFSPASYTLETPTQLTVSNLTQTILGVLTNVGKTFDGPTTQHAGIDTSATGIMVTVKYNNVSSIIYRAGGTTTASAGGADRNYSIYFKNFTYSSPIVTLPITLESFTAVLNGSKADLKWTTSQEINVSHFVVEKSLDGKNFSDAGIVFAYGNTTERKNYSLSDNISNVQQGVIYYRLRTVDNDGKSEISAIRLIRISKQGETLQMVTYPNPVSSELRVTVPAAWQGKEVLFEIFNQSGQKVKALNSSSSSQTETIQVNDLSKGFYIVKASCGGDITQQKIIKN
ncbi:MAG: T9SS type A sorting domain-containing protein [Bacteroidota bacterium]|nr:T9SS type A sorting domain-containing protein [Bacteroidota bacterium]